MFTCFKKFFFLLISTTISFSLVAQSKTIALSGDLGFSFVTHQNQNASPAPLYGAGLASSLGFLYQNRNRIEVTALDRLSAVYIDGQGVTLNTLIEINLFTTWMKGVKLKNQHQLFIGPGFETSFINRDAENLGNNSSSFYYSNLIHVSLRYIVPIQNTKWRVESGLNLALFGYVKANDGFAFNAPQKYLESGNFDYLNSDANNLYRYGYVTGIGQMNRLNTAVSAVKDTRRVQWGIRYQYDITAYAFYEGGQFVNASHSVTAILNYKFGIRKTNQIKTNE